MKRTLAFLLSAALLLSHALGAGTDGGERPNEGIGPYGDAVSFSDVPQDAWFAPYVELCAQRGLLQGTGAETFSPQGTVSMGEAVVMAARTLWQIKGGSGPLPRGGTVEELAQVFYASGIQVYGQEAFEAVIANFSSAAEPFAQSYAWDGLYYLYTQATNQERLLLPDFHLCDPNLRMATRQEFFSAMAFAARELEMAFLNDIQTLPDTEDKAILALYRAGILSGVDEYGTFSATQFLTRAEAAATLARILDPELRLGFTPTPLPYQDYTLTPLLPNCQISWMDPITADRALVTLYDYSRTDPHTGLPQISNGVLWMDGSFHPLEAGVRIASWYPPNPLLAEVVKDIPGSPFESSCGILNLRSHTLSVPLGEYETCQSTPDGHLVLRTEACAALQLLDGDGTFLAVLPEGPVWSCCSEGVAPRLDETSGLYGYVDVGDQWVLPAQWSAAGPFQEGFAVVKAGSGAGLIDKTGTNVLPCRYNRLHNLGGGFYYWRDETGAGGLAGTDGTSAFQDNIGDMSICSGRYISSFDRILNLAGTPVTPPFDFAGPVDENGSALVVVDKQMYRLTFIK